MNAHVVEVAWLDARETVTLTELSQVCGMNEDELRELMEYGALAPLDAGKPELQFSSDCVATLRHAGRLRRDYDLDLFAIALLIEYLHRIEVLERQIRSLQAHVPAHGQTPPREGPQPWHEPHGSGP
jgi:chaperone modulatory protein CbpM